MKSVMKKSSKVFSLILCFVTILSLAFTSFACNKKPTTKHVCEHVCPICKGCTSDCKDEVCKNKCKGHAVAPDINVSGTKYVFSAIDGYADVKGTSVGRTEDFSYASEMTVANDSSVTYSLSSKKAEEMTLLVNVSKVFATSYQKYTDLMTVKINGSVYSSETTCPRATNADEKSFDVINLGKVQIKEGENTFVFSVKAANVNLSFASMTLVGSEQAAIKWLAVPDGVTFNAIDDKAIISGGFTKNNAENCAGVAAYETSTVIFRLNLSEADNEAKLTVNISALPYSVKFTDRFEFKINGENMTSEAVTHIGQQWSNYKDIELGTYSLKKGKNIILFSYNPTPGQVYNFRSLTVETKGIVDWYIDQPITVPETATEKTFDALASSVSISGQTEDGKNVLKKSEGENCIGVDNFGAEGVITYSLKSSVTAPVTLYVVASCETNEFNYSDVFMTMLNGDVLSSSAKTPVGTKWTQYERIEVGNYMIDEGKNTLKFHYNPASYKHFNFRGIILKTEADVTVYTEELPENATEKTFSAGSSNVRLEGKTETGLSILGKKTDCIYGVNTGTGKFYYDLVSSKAAVAEVSLKLGAWNAAQTRIDSRFAPALNGEALITDAKTPAQTGTVVLGRYNLQEGLNTFSFTHTVLSGQSNDFYELIVKTDAELTVYKLVVGEAATEKDFTLTDEKVTVTGKISDTASENAGLQIIYKNDSNGRVCPYKAPKNGEVGMITVKFTSDKKTTMELAIEMSAWNSWAQNFGVIFNPTLNGKDISSDALTVQGSTADVSKVTIGVYEIEEGENVLTFTYAPVENQSWHDLGKLFIKTDAAVALA